MPQVCSPSAEDHRHITNRAEELAPQCPLLAQSRRATLPPNVCFRGLTGNGVQAGLRYGVFFEVRADLAWVARSMSGGGCCSPAIACQTLE